jgi:hypothetical protein
LEYSSRPIADPTGVELSNAGVHLIANAIGIAVRRAIATALIDGIEIEAIALVCRC